LAEEIECATIELSSLQKSHNGNRATYSQGIEYV